MYTPAARAETLTGPPASARIGDVPPDRTSATWILRFPVSFVAGWSYVIFVLIPALDRPATPNAFVLTITLVGLGVILVTELLISPLARVRGRPKRVPVHAAAAVMLIGLAAYAISSMLGYSTYLTQVATGHFAALASVFSPFTPWALIGGVFMIACARHGDLSRKWLLIWLASAVAFHVTISLFVTAITAPSFLFASSLGVGLIVSRILKPRWLPIGLLVATLAWPFFWHLRNETRLESGLSRAQVVGEAPQERLKFDSSLALAEHVKLPNGSVPSVLDLLRFGLIPRVFDTGRGYLSTSQVFNRAVGGAAQSAQSFTLFGDLFVVGGWSLLIVDLVAVSVVTGVLFRRREPLGLVVGVLVVNGFVSLTATFPDSVPTFLQDLLSLVGAVIFILAWVDVSTWWARPQTFTAAATKYEREITTSPRARSRGSLARP
jgi:hypothetical protein